MTVPQSRTLASVLRAQLAPGNELGILVGIYADPPNPDTRRAHIQISGQDLTIPNLNALPAQPAGTPVFVLADNTRMWVLGTVR